MRDSDVLLYLRGAFASLTQSIGWGQKGQEDAVSLHHRLGSLVDSLIAQLSSEKEQDERPDCGAGCGWCCHLRVSVPVPSLFALSHFRTLSEIRMETLPLSPNPMMVPCRFLDTSNNCMIYTHRPFGCRSHSSLSAQACRERLTNPDAPDLSLPTHRQIGLALRRGVGDGLEALRLNRRDAAVDLRLGLDILWSTDHAWDRWRGGETLFAPAWFDVEAGVLGSGLFPLPKRDPLG
ncbi:YkgJ family cysteine cluster protein [Rhodospirillum sp. A1_3_36]|uniref:YkgJ family cysteine cluster protein n=1 Tax=Rhodospirillum sp. A1_3_36 TaxID=3391666 RepID=UPI0039A59D44